MKKETPPHESFARLIDAARTATADTRSPLLTKADVRRALDTSSQNMTNWRTRGVSKEGALQAEQLGWATATYILTGLREPTAQIAARDGINVVQFGAAEPQAAYCSPSSLPRTLDELANLVAGMAPELRPVLASLVDQIVRNPDNRESLIAAARAITVSQSASTAETTPRKDVTSGNR